MASVQFFNFFVGVGKQCRIGSGQCIKQFFNFSLDLCKLDLMGGQFRIYFFFSVMADLKVLKSWPHGIEDKFFQSCGFSHIPDSLYFLPVLYSGNSPDCSVAGLFLTAVQIQSEFIGGQILSWRLPLSVVKSSHR